MPTTLSTQAEQRDGVELLSVAGEIDLFTAARLGLALESALRPGVPLVLDLTGVDFLDSAGMRVLMVADAQANAGGGGLLLVPSEPAARVFEIAGLTSVLRLYPTADEALEAARKCIEDGGVPDAAV